MFMFQSTNAQVQHIDDSRKENHSFGKHNQQV